MKYALIKDRVVDISHQRLFRLLAVSSSAYYAWLKRSPSQRDVANQVLRHQIAKVYWQHAMDIGVSTMN